MLFPLLFHVSIRDLALERKDNYSSNTGRKERQWVKNKEKIGESKGKGKKAQAEKF